MGRKGRQNKIDEEIIDASGVANLVCEDKPAIRKALGMSDLAMKGKEAAASSPAVDANAPISTDDAKNLHEASNRRHNFTLMSRHILNDQQQGQLLCDYKSNPKTFMVIRSELLCVRGHVAKSPVGTSLTFVAMLSLPAGLHY
eukprot:TRINITY_DN116058_c0_g1_i1.p1 TRINITY_DN116058_c0_g1~~TRINITY_DN116058_c0_g1_i1.p1  ORF type:complete len:143 (+),score=29.45 TRINITY_DN116058_c0_g1_i1:48-476(+)